MSNSHGETFTKKDMISFIKWYDGKNEDDCHFTFEGEYTEWMKLNKRQSCKTCAKERKPIDWEYCPECGKPISKVKE